MKRLALTLSLAAFLATAGPAAAKTVSVKDTGFSPASLNVKPKTKVTWVWTGNSVHTIIFDNGWLSPANSKGDKWSRNFKKKGTFRYYCIQHPGMTGKVKVK